MKHFFLPQIVMYRSIYVQKNVSNYACLGNYYPYIHNTYVMSYMSIVYVPKISHSYYILCQVRKRLDIW